MHIGLQAPEETSFTWSNPRRVSFQFNQEPAWLPKYRHLGFPRLVSLCQITHESKTSSWLKKPKHHPHNFGVGHAFFLLFHSRNSKLKNRTAPWAGEFFDRIVFFLASTQQQSLTNWMNVCPILASATDSSKQTPPQIFPIPRKPQILKKKNLESI